MGVARCEVRIDRYEGVGESQRQEDRRGTLAVESGPPMRGSGGVADRLRPLPMDACGPPVRRPRSYYRPDPPRVERHSTSPALFLVAGRLLGSSRGVGPSAPRNPARQTHFRRLGGPLGAPRLSSPRREPEEENSFAITTDDLMNTDQIESVASTPDRLAKEILRQVN